MNKETGIIRIGTRGSPLALYQAEYMKRRLLEVDGTLSIEIDVISTRGDRTQKENIALSQIGGKGLFTLEIEEKLTSGEIDLAVHSAKDMPTALPKGLTLACYPEREEVADAFISPKAEWFTQLPKNAVVGSASLRRRALMLRQRPDLEMIMFRGNVATRLQKLADGVADATLLACAGLNRLEKSHLITSKLPVEDFLPAPGQGAITVEIREDNDFIRSLLVPINHGDTHVALTAERAFLAELDGSCRTPLGAHAIVEGEKLSLHAIILKPDGSEAHEDKLEGTRTDAAALGEAMGKRLREVAGSHFFDDWV